MKMRTLYKRVDDVVPGDVILLSGADLRLVDVTRLFKCTVLKHPALQPHFTVFLTIQHVDGQCQSTRRLLQSRFVEVRGTHVASFLWCNVLHICVGDYVKLIQYNEPVLVTKIATTQKKNCSITVQGEECTVRLVFRTTAHLRVWTGAFHDETKTNVS